MKKLFIFYSSLLISLWISAQNTPVKSTTGNNFCEVLSKVIANAPDNFKKIQIGDDYLDLYDLPGNSIGQGWKTSVKFPGAMKSYVRRDEYLNNPYEAYFGSFKKLTDATKKLNSIKSQLSTCVKGYKVKVEKWDSGLSWGVPIRYEYTRKTNDLTQVVRREISRSGTNYSLYLLVQGMNPLMLKSKADQELEDLFGNWPTLNFDTTSGSTGQAKENKSVNANTQKLIDDLFMDINTQEHEIRSVKIGTQTWMAENLNTSTFRNGDPIPQALSMTDWDKAAEEEKPVWCYYNYDPENGKKYGKLYNWYAVNDTRGLAPNGWHIPKAIDWERLKFFLGKNSGIKMKSTSGWPQNANGNNSSGFTGLPGGVQYSGYMDPGKWGCWWSTTRSVSFLEPNTKDRDCYCLSYEKDELDSYSKSLGEGLSVRCIKD